MPPRVSAVDKEGLRLQAVQQIRELLKKLPNLPKAAKGGKIYAAIKDNTGDTDPWEVLNKRFDILYGENLRDKDTGRLPNIEAGTYGLGGFCNYLERTVQQKGMGTNHEIIMLRLDHIVAELQHYLNTPAPTPVAPKKKSTAPKPKDPVADAREKLHDVGVGALARHIFPETVALQGDSTKDKTYKPPIRTPREDDEDSHVDDPLHGDDGEEYVATPSGSEDENVDGDDGAGTTAARGIKRKHGRSGGGVDNAIELTSSDESDDDSITVRTKAKGRTIKSIMSTCHAGRVAQGGCERTAKQLKRAEKKRRQRKRAKTDVFALPDGGESDGESAARAAQAREEQRQRASRRGPENQTLPHWHPPKAIVDNKGDRHLFKCRWCNAERTVARTISATEPFDNEPTRPNLSNLATHTKSHRAQIDEAAAAAAAGDGDGQGPRGTRHTGVGSESAELMASFISEGILHPASSPTQNGFNRVFSGFILGDGLNFDFGDSKFFARFLKYAHVNFKLPSDTTVRNQLCKVFVELKDAVIREFAAVKSKIATSTDSWTNKGMLFTFAGTIANWIDADWELLERVVDFRHLGDDEHTGVAGARAFLDGLRGMGIATKIYAVTLDNVSSNDVLCRTLAGLLMKRYGIPFNPDNAQIHCLAHVVNLVVQKILKLAGEVDDDPDARDYYELFLKHLPFHFNINEDEDLQAWEEEEYEDEGWEVPEDGEDGDEVTEVPTTALGKLRLLTKKITSSPQNRGRFRSFAIKHYDGQYTEKDTEIALLMVITDMRVRWNSTQAMMGRGILMRDAIDDFAFNSKKYRHLLLSEAEWDSIVALNAVLEIFTKVTETMSVARSPTLCWQLPMYEHMRKHMVLHIDNPSTSLALREALAAGKEKLMHYYTFAKNSMHARMATMCHPGLRDNWFANLGQDAHNQARVLFEAIHQMYVESDMASSSPDKVPTPAASTAKADFLETVGAAPVIPEVAAASKQSECKRWFAYEGGRREMKKPLAWWKEHESCFPVIARMPRDFLAIPGTSVAVERLFSKSRHICVDTRSSLKANSITESILVQKWLEDPKLWYDIIEQRKAPRVPIM